MAAQEFTNVKHLIVDPDNLSNCLGFLDRSEELKKCEVLSIKKSGNYYIIAMINVDSEARKFIKDHQFDWVSGEEYEKFRKE